MKSRQAIKGLQSFFELLEQRAGGLILDEAAKVVTTESFLHPEHLQGLLRHEHAAIHVKQFLPEQEALGWAQQLITEETHNWKVTTSRGNESSDVATIGMPYNMASSTEEYFQKAQEEARKRRVHRHNYHRHHQSNSILTQTRDNATSTTHNNSSIVDSTATWAPPGHALYPLDLLRLSLDEASATGARLAREKNPPHRHFAAGLCRIMKGPTRWKKGFIHVDEMGPLDEQRGLFSANIYLQLPPIHQDTSINTNASTVTTTSTTTTTRAGTPTMRIWPLNIRSRWDWYRNARTLSALSSQDAEDQVRLRSKLGPSLQIDCRPGDLVLLCAQRPHEAVGFAQGTRVSLQCFIQHHGPKESLLIDC